MAITSCFVTFLTVVLGAIGVIGVLSLDFTKLFNLIIDFKFIPSLKYGLRVVPLALAFVGIFAINQKKIVIGNKQVVKISSCSTESKVAQAQTIINCVALK